MLRIAVLGCGRIGRMHAENIAAHPRATLAGVYDVVASASTEVAERLGVPAFDSAEATLTSRDVDAVLIATSTPTHADLLEAAVAAGKPVLCEKPIDLNLARVNACAERIGRTEVPIMLGFVRRFDPGHRAVRDAVQSGAFVYAVEKGVTPEVGFEDGRLALVLAEAALKSAAEGRTVHVNEIG
jgi:myo-inositol 2-dehydrogenase/D-chiro-inositol 1-dehydrogenase